MQMVSALGQAHWFKYYQSGLVIRKKKTFLYTIGTPLKAHLSLWLIYHATFLTISLSKALRTEVRGDFNIHATKYFHNAAL